MEKRSSGRDSAIHHGFTQHHLYADSGMRSLHQYSMRFRWRRQSRGLRRGTISGKSGAGFTLIEALVGLAILMVAVILFASFAQSVIIAQPTKHRAVATQIAQSEIEALRRMPFLQLPFGTNLPFRNLPFNHGAWRVIVDPADSSNNALTVTPSAAAPLPAVGMLPGNVFQDGTFAADVKVTTLSGSWTAGLLLRYQDAEHYYFAQIRNNGIRFIRHVDGVETVLLQVNGLYSFGTWYTLAVTAIGSSFSLTLNGVPIGSPVTDATLTEGAVALASIANVTAMYDNVRATTTQTVTWDFENDADIGSLPADWERIGIEDLPSGEAVLAVEASASAPYNGSTNIRFVTVTVRWNDGSIRTVALQTIIAR